MSRPRESADKTERRMRAVRFSDAEWSRVKTRAAALDLPVAQYVRNLTLGTATEIQQATPSAVDEPTISDLR